MKTFKKDIDAMKEALKLKGTICIQWIDAAGNVLPAEKQDAAPKPEDTVVFFDQAFRNV